MADAAVQEAIYSLRYSVGDSVQQLQAARTGAMALAAASDKLAESEVNVAKATLQQLAALDPRIRAEQRAADSLQKITTLYRDGKATAEQYAFAVGKIQENYLKVTAANDNAAGSFSKFGSALGIARNLLGAFGIALSAATVVSFVKSTLTAVAALDDQAEVLGITTDALQAYRISAMEAGASTDFIQKALERYVRSVGEANEGNKKIREAFLELGVTANDLAGDPSASLSKTVSAIGKIEEVTGRAAKEVIFFGRSGQQMEQVIKSWATPIDEAIARFKEMNLIVSEEQIKAYDKAESRIGLFFQRLMVLTVDAIDALTSYEKRWKMIGEVAASVLGMKLDTADYPGAKAGAFNIPYAPKAAPTVAPWVDDAAVKKAEADRLKAIEAEADAIYKLSQVRAKMWEENRVAQDKARAEFDKGVVAQIVGITRVQIAEEVAAAKRLETIIRLNAEIDQKRIESGEKYDAEAKRSREKEVEEIKRYQEGIADDILFSGKSFFMEFVATGKASWKDLFGDLKATFARVLYEMIIEAKLKPIILNIIGGSGGAAGGGGGGLLGLGLLGGGSSGGTDGGGFGGFLSKWLAPIALGVGLVASLFKQKPSDMRSVATFVPGMTDYGVGPQSAHETSQATLTAAQQAADAIRLEVLALKEAGVQFTQQLSNIWIGERDESTFQLAGGQRVGVGSVGDPTDLAVDVLAALLKGATSNDPKIQAILSGGGSSQAIASALTALQQAKDFTDAIEQAILGIKDPLKAALDLWKRESEARLAAATALGVNIDQVKELNELLYKQVVTQQNAGALSSVGGLIDQLEYGPGSSAAPNKQYASALKDYEAAKKAAVGGGAAEAMAYAQQTSSFLPFAREFLGTSVEYGKIETGALSTLKGLQTSLSAAPAMPSLQPVVTQVAVSGATTVEAVKEQTVKIEDLTREVKLSNAIFGSVMAKFATFTP